jgi:hypothetical protein
MSRKLGKPKNYVKPDGTLVRFGDKLLVIESRPGPRRKKEKEPQIANIEALRTIIAINDETIFNEEQQAAFSFKDTTIGRGEMPIRMHKGCTAAPIGSRASMDIRAHEYQPWLVNDILITGNIEIKEWGRLRPGDATREQWEYFVTGLSIEYAKEIETPIIFGNKETTYRRQFCKSLTKSFLEILPDYFSQKVRDELRPSNILKCYDNLIFVWREGYLVIPGCEYDDAFESNGVSQGLPRYVIRRKYLEQRAIKSLPNYTKRQGKTMKKIACIAMSGKPFHEGHRKLIALAARENNWVHVWISLDDRNRPGQLIIRGTTMEKLWKEQFEKLLPANVTVHYTHSAPSPIEKVYEFLGAENEAGSDDSYKIYGRSGELNERFPPTKLELYADRLYAMGRCQTEPVYSSETASVSGTEMRQWLLTGDKERFMEFVPKGADGEAIWEALTTNMEIAPLKKSAKRKKK